MASPQIENGYVKISNELIEAMALKNLCGAEWKILMVVIRKTFGYNKKSDKISISQFCNLANMRRPNVCRALKRLVAKQLLGSSQTATGEMRTYWLIKDYEKWLPQLPKQLPSSQIATRSSSQTATQPVAKQLPTKDNYTKDNKKHIHTESSKRIIQFFNKQCNTRYTYGTNGRFALSLLKAGHNEEDIKKVIIKMEKKWRGGDMARYIRPETIFRPSKFESYLNEKENRSDEIKRLIYRD